jgi:hypothetical protein
MDYNTIHFAFYSINPDIPLLIKHNLGLSLCFTIWYTSFMAFVDRLVDNYYEDNTQS